MNTRLWADFNEVYGEDQIWTSLRQSPSAFFAHDTITSGEWVELYDGDGNTCLAQITEVNLPIVHARLDWGTWVSAPTWTVEVWQQHSPFFRRTGASTTATSSHDSTPCSAVTPARVEVPA